MLNLKNQKLLVIAPHPDDEVLGCGGLIKRVKEEGGHVYVLFMTVGDTDDYRSNSQSQSIRSISTGDERKNEIEKVAKFLAYDDYRIVFPGNGYHLRLDQLALKDIMAEIENGTRISLNKIKPTIVTTPTLSDYNQDHRKIAQAVFAATRPSPDEIKPLQRVILGCESVATADWWDQSPTKLSVFVELSKKHLEAKLTALSLYVSQLRNGNHPRSLQSVRTLAQFRGMQIGTNAAEAYSNYRIVI